MQGRLSIREDEAPRLIPDVVLPLEHIDIKRLERAAKEAAPDLPPPPEAKSAPPASARKLYLKAANEQVRDQALSILMRTPGAIRVTFVMADSGKAFLAPERCWVSDSVDLSALKALLGEGAVVLK